MRELYRLMKETRASVLPRATAPAIILHSILDDLASVKNALFVQDHIASGDVQTVLLHNSYHKIPIDNERERAAGEIIRFFRERSEYNPGLSSSEPRAETRAAPR